MRVGPHSQFRAVRPTRGNPRTQGRECLSAGASRGASAAVVSYPNRATNSPSALSLLQVQDTLTSLHKLATSYRRLMPRDCRNVLNLMILGQHEQSNAVRPIRGNPNRLADRGASTAVASCHTSATNSPSALSLLQVQDTLTSLHGLATSYRRLMPPTTCVVGDGSESRWH